MMDIILILYCLELICIGCAITLLGTLLGTIVRYITK